MRKLKSKDKKKRIFFASIEKPEFVLKLFHKNTALPSFIRLRSAEQLTKLNKFKSKTQITKRCVVTTSKKSFTKLSNFSRMKFSKDVGNGLIFGFRKSSW